MIDFHLNNILQYIFQWNVKCFKKLPFAQLSFYAVLIDCLLYRRQSVFKKSSIEDTKEIEHMIITFLSLFLLKCIWFKMPC